MGARMRARTASSPYEHMFGEQFGEQIERNPGELRSKKPSKHGLYHLSDTPSLRLGAGRSQVQILSPRYVRTPSTAGNTRETPRKC